MQLVNKTFLVTIGTGRGMKYELSDLFKEYEVDYNQLTVESILNKNYNSGNNENNSGNNENKLLEISKLSRDKKRLEPEIMEQIIIKLCEISPLTSIDISKYLNRDSEGIRKKYIKKLLDENKIKLIYPDNLNHPLQAYYKDKI